MNQSLDQLRHYNEYLEKKIPIRIAFIKPNGSPSVISLWYVIIDKRIYCATQNTAKIVSYFQKNPICGFEIAADTPPYKGIRGEGVVKISKEKGKHVLNILMQKYLGKKNSTLSQFLKANSKSEVAIEIIPQRIVCYDYSKRMRDV